jgi:6-phosphogluconolactonase (cycloisomerase 2 family)
LKFLLSLAVALFLLACSLDSSTSGTSTKYTVGGTVSGLETGWVVSLKLVGDGGSLDNQNVSSSGSFTFGPLLSSGVVYQVTVETQPRGQVCTVTNGSGTLAQVNVTNVTINCTNQSSVVYVTQEMTGTVVGYRIDSRGGELMEAIPSVSTGTGSFLAPKGIAVAANGKYAYVTNEGINTVAAFSIDAATGALTSVGSTPTQAGPLGVAVDPAGKFVYVAEPGARTVSSYAVNPTTGGLTFAKSHGPTVPSDALVGVSLAVAPSGDFVYFAVGHNGQTGSLRVDRTSGGMTLASYWNGMAKTANQIVVHPGGRFGYVAIGEYEEATGHVVVLSLDPVTGEMTRASAVDITGIVRGVAVDPTGKYLYAIESKNKLIYAYSINAASGALTRIGSTIATGTSPEGVTVDRGGKFVYVANGGSHTISMYEINAATGVLSGGGLRRTGDNTQPFAITSF